MKHKILSLLCTFALILSVLPVGRAEVPYVPGEEPAAEETPTTTEISLPAETSEDPAEPSSEPAESDAPAESDLPPEEDTAEPPQDNEPGNEEPAEDSSAEPLILVGLAYGSSTLPGANLKNSTGSGYRFGYLDNDRIFRCLGSTEETDISVVITQNVWYGSSNDYTSYSDKITSDIMVGCWHVTRPDAVSSFEEALAAAQTYEDGYPAWIEGNWEVRTGSYATRSAAQTAADEVGGTMGGTGAYGVAVVKRGTSQILFEFDGGSADLSLTVMPGLDDSVKTATYFKNVRYFGGFQYCRIKGEDMVISNALPLNDYLECVISQEMSPSWPLEALKAQVLCAKGFYSTNVGRHNSNGFDLCPKTHCQAYPGMGSTNDNTAQAVAETSGLWVWYNGKLAETYYFSSDGGSTEDVRNIWSDNANMPYLCGVIDPYEAYVEDKISGYSWKKTYTAGELTELLRSKGYGVGDIVDFQATTITPTGNVKSFTFYDSNGKSWPFNKTKTIELLGLRSYHYTISSTTKTVSGTYYTQDGTPLNSLEQIFVITGDGTVKAVTSPPYVITAEGVQPPLHSGAGDTETSEETIFTISGSGWGHNIGMSQWGAYSMALQGYTFEDILTFYYPGVQICAEGEATVNEDL